MIGLLLSSHSIFVLSQTVDPRVDPSPTVMTQSTTGDMDEYYYEDIPITSVDMSTVTTADSTGYCDPNFLDSDGDGCTTYEGNGWCGASWLNEYENSQGQTAVVCPQCGCVESASDRFSMTGDCDIQDNCVSSENYPNAYEHDAYCLVTLLREASVTFRSPFGIEVGYDNLILRLNDAYLPIYQMAELPLHLHRGDILQWRTDGSVNDVGWELCFFAPISERPKVNLFNISGDGCVQNPAHCISSHEYPIRYEHDQSCVVTMNRNSSVIVSPTFEIERCCDHLVIHGREIKDAESVPKHMLAGESFSWDTDADTSYSGWRLCFFENTAAPTNDPTGTPTRNPTTNPTQVPSTDPTQAPSQSPTKPPTQSPIRPPTQPPICPPTRPPTQSPNRPPTQTPTVSPTHSSNNTTGGGVAPMTDDSSEGIAAWIIVVVVLAALFFVGLLLLSLYMFYKKERKKEIIKQTRINEQANSYHNVSPAYSPTASTPGAVARGKSFAAIPNAFTPVPSPPRSPEEVLHVQRDPIRKRFPPAGFSLVQQPNPSVSRVTRSPADGFLGGLRCWKCGVETDEDNYRDLHQKSTPLGMANHPPHTQEPEPIVVSEQVHRLSEPEEDEPARDLSDDDSFTGEQSKWIAPAKGMLQTSKELVSDLLEQTSPSPTPLESPPVNTLPPPIATDPTQSTPPSKSETLDDELNAFSNSIEEKSPELEKVQIVQHSESNLDELDDAEPEKQSETDENKTETLQRPSESSV